MPSSPSNSDPKVTESAHTRRNGWNCPWHPLQFTAWFFIGLFTFSYYGFLVHYVPGLWSIIAYVGAGLILLALVVTMIVTTTIDPAEPKVRRKFTKKRHRLRPQLDRSVHKHVIENQYCNLCQADVSSSAKHCRVCDKCVTDFDHHCKWLNNCIGSQNYRWFLATIFMTLIGSLLLFLYNVALFILFFADRDRLRYDCFNPTNISSCDDTLRVLGAAVPDPVFPTLVAVLGLLSVIALILVGHLSCFHVYLLIKGLSTYDYIILQRERDEREETPSDSDAADAPSEQGRCTCVHFKRKHNRVLPLDEEASIGDSPPPPPTRNRKSSNSGSVGSAGMATFGRTPPPSDCAEDYGIHDNWTDEQKLANGTFMSMKGKKQKQGGGDVVIEMDTIMSLRQTTNTETVINMDMDEDASLPVHMKPTTSSITRQQQPQYDLGNKLNSSSYEDDNCGTLAFMSAVHDEELPASSSDDLDCSLLPAMVVSNSLGGEVSTTSLEKEEEQNTVVKQDEVLNVDETELKDVEVKKEMVDRATSPTIPAHLVPTPTPINTTVPDVDPQNVTGSIAPNCSVPNVNSYSSLADEDLQVDTLQQLDQQTQMVPPSPPSTEELKDQPIKKQNSTDPSPLYELPLSTLSQFLHEVQPVSGISNKTSGDMDKPTTAQNLPKRVSFEGLTDEVVATPQYLGPLLLGRPLPPIGSDSMQNIMISPRSNRPLPPSPLTTNSCDNVSMQSTSSQLLTTGSTLSLPVLPDPRYSSAARKLPKLVIKSQSKMKQSLVTETKGNSHSQKPPTPPRSQTTPSPTGYRLKTTAFSHGMIPTYDDVPQNSSLELHSHD